MDAFTAFQKYLALKQHFNKDGYDYFKYGGKITAKISSFEMRKDKYMFHKLSKKKDLEGFIVSNMLENENIWVRDMLTSESDQIFTEWLKRQQSISYLFESDIAKLTDDLNENLIIKDNEYPYLLKLFMRKEICIETLIICNDVLNFFGHWNKHITDPVIWPGAYKKCMKYKPFIKYDKDRCKQILKQRFV